MVEWYVAVSLARHILHSPHSGREFGTNPKTPSAIFKLPVTYADSIVILSAFTPRNNFSY